MTLRTEELAAQIKPYVIKWMQNMVLQDTIGRHELGGSLHTGQISDSQAPQFLKTDGSRALSGNLAVSEFTTIDGVDLDVFLSSFDLHTLDPDAHHDAVTVLDSDTINLSLSGQQVSGSVLFGDGILGGVGGIRPDWATGATGLSAASLNAPGSATSVARGDHTHQITTTDDPDGVTATILKSTAAGLLTLRGLTLRGDLMPFSPDGANIGSSSYPFLTGHISEMYGQRFVEETIQVAGGHWIIPQSSATLAADMDGSTTTMTVTENQGWEANDYLVMRDIGQVEYFKVVSGSGTTWTVERNKDASGANTWSIGAVVANLGKNGEGWLEAQGGSVPGFSVWRRTGDLYANTLEVARLGELTNWQTAGLTGVGLGIGSVAGNEYLTYTPSEGLVVRGTIRADDGYLGTLDVSGKLTVSGAGGVLAIGVTPPTSYNVGTGLWLDRNGLRGLLNDVEQVRLDASTGALTWGDKNLYDDQNKLDIDGLNLLAHAWGTTYKGSDISWGFSGNPSSHGVVMKAQTLTYMNEGMNFDISANSNDETNIRLLAHTYQSSIKDAYLTLASQLPEYGGVSATIGTENAYLSVKNSPLPHIKTQATQIYQVTPSGTVPTYNSYSKRTLGHFPDGLNLVKWMAVPKAYWTGNLQTVAAGAFGVRNFIGNFNFTMTGSPLWYTPAGGNSILVDKYALNIPAAVQLEYATPTHILDTNWFTFGFWFYYVPTTQWATVMAVGVATRAHAIYVHATTKQVFWHCFNTSGVENGFALGNVVQNGWNYVALQYGRSGPTGFYMYGMLNGVWTILNHTNTSDYGQIRASSGAFVLGGNQVNLQFEGKIGEGFTAGWQSAQMLTDFYLYTKPLYQADSI